MFTIFAINLRQYAKKEAKSVYLNIRLFTWSGKLEHRDFH